MRPLTWNAAASKSPTLLSSGVEGSRYTLTGPLERWMRSWSQLPTSLLAAHPHVSAGAAGPGARTHLEPPVIPHLHAHHAGEDGVRNLARALPSTLVSASNRNLRHRMSQIRAARFLRPGSMHAARGAVRSPKRARIDVPSLVRPHTASPMPDQTRGRLVPGPSEVHMLSSHIGDARERTR
jgi:hypothetical protein